MSIRNEQEKSVTQEKLHWLEERLAALQKEPAEDTLVREQTLRSLRKMIKQMKEELLRYKTGVGSMAGDADEGTT